MNKDILELSNNIIYHGVMAHGDPSVAAQKVVFPREVNSMLTWLEEIKKRSVTFLKTDRVIMSLKIKERQRYRYKNFFLALVSATFKRLRSFNRTPLSGVYFVQLIMTISQSIPYALSIVKIYLTPYMLRCVLRRVH